MLLREPGSKQHCPIAADCWSPTTPLIEIALPVIEGCDRKKLDSDTVAYITDGEEQERYRIFIRMKRDLEGGEGGVSESPPVER